MIFGLERFLPSFLTSFKSAAKKGKRNTQEFDCKKGTKNGSCRKHLQRKASKKAQRLWKEDLSFRSKGSTISTTNANNNQQPKDRETPLGLLKRIWRMKHVARVKASKQHSGHKIGLPEKAGGSKTKNYGRHRKRKQRSLCKSRGPKRQTRSTVRDRMTMKKSKYASEKPDLKVVKVRRVKRYTSPGENSREKRLKLPIWTPQTDRDRIINENPTSFNKCVEKFENDTMDDPLNINQIHGNYVKGIYGRPADIAKEENPNQGKRRRGRMAKNRRRIKWTVNKPFKRRRMRLKKSASKTRPQTRSRSKGRMGRRELDFLIQSRHNDKMEARRSRRGR